MNPDVQRLVKAARRAVFKMEAEYRRQRSDTEENENWAETDRLKEALSDFDRIYPVPPWYQ